MGLLVLLLCEKCYAQQGVTTVGLQIKPIIPAGFLRTSSSEFVENTEFSFNQKLSFSGGMVIRHGFTRSWSVEGGINYALRRFDFRLRDTDSNRIYNDQLRITSYEIPLLALLYIRLSDKIFMNVSFGTSLNFYPSSVGKTNRDYDIVAYRKNWLQSSILANLGYEFRTKEKGYFYIGASFHRPFNYIYKSSTDYLGGTGRALATSDLNLFGDYLTLDLRYFFHEKPRLGKKSRRRDRGTRN